VGLAWYAVRPMRTITEAKEKSQRMSSTDMAAARPHGTTSRREQLGSNRSKKATAPAASSFRGLAGGGEAPRPARSLPCPALSQWAWWPPGTGRGGCGGGGEVGWGGGEEKVGVRGVGQRVQSTDYRVLMKWRECLRPACHSKAKLPNNFEFVLLFLGKSLFYLSVM
jgi:hypothetical protein